MMDYMSVMSHLGFPDLSQIMMTRLEIAIKPEIGLNVCSNVCRKNSRSDATSYAME